MNIRPLLIACLLCAGCKTAPQMGETSAPRYDRVNLVYDLNARYRDLPLSDNRLKAVSFETHDGIPVSSGPRWRSAKLSVAYPPPNGNLAMARATLRLSSGDDRTDISPVADRKATWMHKLRDPSELFATNPDDERDVANDKQDDEIWVLDFPKQQLDLLLADLSQAGFFESQVRQTPGTKLEVQIDHGRTSKNWTPEPRLDDFINRVYGEGHLDGFVSGKPAKPRRSADDNSFASAPR